ncbi:alpha/beta fold hydrolase, partial [Methylobacterium organophilum]|nr:alpha/beta fold hydrolase [Methylobacterium organophilum]
MARETDPDTSAWSRRRLLKSAVATAALAELGVGGTARAQGAPAPGAPVPGVMPGVLKQVEAGVLDVGYVEAGPADGPAVILLHGWPYDIHAFAEVVPILAAAGHRVIVPYLRGYGTTRFLASDTVRNGEQAALAVDVIALMDALKIPQAILGGFDWGARTADIVAALWPERCRLGHSRPREGIRSVRRREDRGRRIDRTGSPRASSALSDRP